MLSPDLAERLGPGRPRRSRSRAAAATTRPPPSASARRGAATASCRSAPPACVFAATDKPVALPERALHGFCHALPGRWHGMAVVLSGGARPRLDRRAHRPSRDDIAGFLARAETFAADAARRAHAPVFLPYLTGERTPHNDPLATAHFAGLTVEHDAAALGYAVVEGVAFALADCLDVLVEAGAAPTILHAGRRRFAQRLLGAADQRRDRADAGPSRSARNSARPSARRGWRCSRRAAPRPESASSRRSAAAFAPDHVRGAAAGRAPHSDAGAVSCGTPQPARRPHLKGC